MTSLAEQVLKILRRMEPYSALKALRLDIPSLTDDEILERCRDLGVEVDAALKTGAL
jgi:post-segregation antitoxin (ccd killing protein)